MASPTIVRRRCAPVLVAIAFVLAPGVPAAPGEPIWRLAGDEEVDHRRAGKLCDRLDAEGRSDWRLPTPDELDRLAVRAEEGSEEALAVLAGLGGDAAWTRDVSETGLAWAAAFAHGFQLRIHQGNERALRALCVAGAEEEVSAASPELDELTEGPWQRPLDVETDSPLLWGCAGDVGGPVVLTGSIEKFNRLVPPGPLRETVPVDFVIGAEGRPRWAGPAPDTSERLGGLAIDTLETLTFAPATCDGEPVPIFFHIDFGRPPE